MTKRLPIAVALACAVSGGATLFYASSLAPRVHAATRMPDLIVDQASLRQHWVVRTEDLPATFCSVQEGGITPGEHHLLRFTVSTPNIGDADLAVGDPNQHLNDGLFEFATCHNHYHFKHYALYQLIDQQTGQVWRAAKRGFCMIDIEKYQLFTGTIGKRQFTSCGRVGIPGNQGISIGWADVYVWKLGGQYFVLDGGDGQPEVPPGDYVIRITVNPPFRPGPGELCPNRDSLGFCHTLPESDYQNNIAQVSITIPDHNGRTAVGPLKNQPAITEEPIDGQ